MLQNILPQMMQVLCGKRRARDSGGQSVDPLLSETSPLLKGLSGVRPRILRPSWFSEMSEINIKSEES